jgi:hypothetical protein
MTQTGGTGPRHAKIIDPIEEVIGPTPLPISATSPELPTPMPPSVSPQLFTDTKER